MSLGFNTVKKTLSVQVDDSAFNEVIGSSRFLTIGDHKVTIENIEAKDTQFGEQFVVTYVSESGASMRHFMNLHWEDKKTGVKKLTSPYLKFTRAFFTDDAARIQYFNYIVKDSVAKLGALHGLSVTITVSQGKKGYDIIQDPAAPGYILVDVATKVKVLPDTYPTYGEANQAGKDAGLKRAYNDITDIKVTPEEAAANEQLLRSALQAGEAAQKSVAAVKPSML